MTTAAPSLSAMQRARAQLMIHHPFFASIIASTPLVVREDIPYMATDAKTLMVNPAACADWSVGELKTGLAHEGLHIVLSHVPRMIQHRYDRQRWNFATDYAINLTLVECGFEALTRIGWLYDPQYTGLSADDIYQRLESQCKEGGGGGGTGQPKNGMGEDLQEPADANDPDAMAKLARETQQRVAQAASIARMAGKLPASLERLVQEILDPVVPWPDVLREYMTRCTPDDESWTRRNRRFSELSLPSRRTERMGEIVVIGDTSGSITNADLSRIAAEVRSISEMMRPEKFRLVWADTEVAGEQEFDMYDDVVCQPAGGGGTDMRVPLAHVEQYDAQVVVLITDGYTPWPDAEPPFPLIVLCTTDVACPIGQVIRV